MTHKKGRQLRGADRAAKRGREEPVVKTVQDCSHWRLKVVVESTDPRMWPAGALKVDLTVPAGVACRSSSQRTRMTAHVSPKLDYQGRRAGAITLSPSFEDANDRRLWSWVEAAKSVDVPRDGTVVLQARPIGVEVVSVTPNFAPTRDDVAVRLRLIHPGEIRTVLLEIADFADRPVYQQLWRNSVRRLNRTFSPQGGANVTWTRQDNGVVTLLTGATAERVHGLRGPFRVRAWVCKDDLQTAEACKAQGMPNVLPDGVQVGTLGGDLCVIRYPIRLEQLAWSQIYRRMSGHDPAVVPLDQAPEVQIMWAQYKLNEMGCFAGPITTHTGLDLDPATHAEFMRALQRYRVMRRVPLETSYVPEGTRRSEELGPHGLVEVDLRAYRGENASGLFFRWDGDNFVPRTDSVAAAGLPALQQLDVRSLKQLLVFLDMETPDVVFDSPDRLLDPTAQVKLYLDSDRYYFNFTDEFRDAREAFAATESEKYAYENEWLSAPCFALCARIEVEDRSGQVHDPGDPGFPLAVHFSWTDEPEDLSRLPAESTARPSLTRAYVRQAKEAVSRRVPSRYHNTRALVGGLIGADEAANARAIFRRLADGAAFAATTDAGVLVPHTPDDGAAIHVQTGRVAGDNYRIHARLRGADAAEQARLDWVHAARPGDVYPARPKADTPSPYRTAKIELWRRFHLAALVTWPVRDAQRTWRGQEVDQASWDVARQEFAHAYVEAPSWADVEGVKHAIDTLPDIAARFDQAMAKVIATKQEIRQAFGVAEIDAEFKRGVSAQFDGPRKDINTELGKLYAMARAVPPDAAYRALKAAVAVLEGNLAESTQHAASHYRGALAAIANSAGDGVDPSLVQPLRGGLVRPPFDHNGRIMAFDPSSADPPYPAEVLAEYENAKGAVASKLNGFNSPYSLWLQRAQPNFAQVTAAHASITSIPAYTAENFPTATVTAVQTEIWEKVRDFHLDAIAMISDAGRTSFLPGLTARSFAGDPHFSMTGTIDAPRLEVMVSQGVLTFDPNCIIARPLSFPPGSPLTESEVRAVTNDLSSALSFPLCEVFNDTVRGTMLMAVQDGKFVRRTHGVIVVDNLTFPQVTVWDEDPGTGAKLTEQTGSPRTRAFYPMGFSLGQPLGVTFWSHHTPMNVGFLMTHEISHLWSLMHWQNAGGMQRDGHDQADTNCVMSYPVIGVGMDADSFAAITTAAWRRLRQRALDGYPKAKSPDVYLNGGTLWVFKEHFLARDYQPHHCGKCNLQLRGWNIFAGASDAPALPKASKSPPASGVTQTRAPPEYLPYRDAGTNDYDPRTYERSGPIY